MFWIRFSVHGIRWSNPKLHGLNARNSMLKCFAVFSKAMPKSSISELHAFKCMLYCFPVVAGVLNDNDKEGFYNYTLLMHVTVLRCVCRCFQRQWQRRIWELHAFKCMLQCCAVFVDVFKDNDKEGFVNYTLFNAWNSAALCL